MRNTQLRKIRRSKLARHHGASLARSVFGHIYHALTGSLPAPEALVRRATANGLSTEELAAVMRDARTIERLPEYLFTVSQQRLERAVYWDDLGLKQRARDNYLDSALWAIYADLMADDYERKTEIYRQCARSYALAAGHLSPAPAQPLALDYLASTLPGYIRVPANPQGAEPALRSVPCAVILNNLASPREELHYTENSLLSQGLATLSFDYPGTGEHAGQPFEAFDPRELANSIYFFLAARPEIDVSRVVVYGLGFGARLALTLGSLFPERFAAIVSISAPFDVTTEIDALAPVLARELLISHVSARAALLEMSGQHRLDERLCEIQAPLLVVGGGRDPIALSEDTQYIFEQAGSADKKLIFCPGACHNLYDMMPSLRYEIAQWIRQRISASTPSIT